MPNTVTIDDDILATARERANQENKTVDEVVSGLVRKALDLVGPEPVFKNGIRLLPVQPGARTVTTEFVREMMEDMDLHP